MNVKLSDFGRSLSSRLKGREVFGSIEPNIVLSNRLILDFDGIRMMTLSFGTELFDSINMSYCGEIEIINANDSLINVIDFCRSNLKPILA